MSKFSNQPSCSATVENVKGEDVNESASKPTLLEVLASLQPLDESLPEIDDLPLDDVELET